MSDDGNLLLYQENCKTCFVSDFKIRLRFAAWKDFVYEADDSFLKHGCMFMLSFFIIVIKWIFLVPYKEEENNISWV